MALDTEAKRRGFNAVRSRLPWFRRFSIPTSDNIIGFADRQQVAHIYPGIIVRVVGPGSFAEATVNLPQFSESTMSEPQFAQSHVSVPSFGVEDEF